MESKVADQSTRFDAKLKKEFDGVNTRLLQTVKKVNAVLRKIKESSEAPATNKPN